MQIALFLENILFVLGSSQASNVGGVCSVANLRPQSLSIALSVRSDECMKQAAGFGRLQGAKRKRRLCLCNQPGADVWDVGIGDMKTEEQKRPGKGLVDFLIYLHLVALLKLVSVSSEAHSILSSPTLISLFSYVDNEISLQQFN